VGAEALGGLQQYRLSDAFGILVHFVVPEADHGPSILREELRALLVIGGVYMLAAIDFDDQLRLTAGEIGGLRIDRELACEFGAIARQQMPNDSFLRRRIGAQGPSSVGQALRDAAAFHLDAFSRCASRTHP